jgi:hypothetical protein
MTLAALSLILETVQALHKFFQLLPELQALTQAIIVEMASSPSLTRAEP